jgi:hypothetical protein
MISGGGPDEASEASRRPHKSHRIAADYTVAVEDETMTTSRLSLLLCAVLGVTVLTGPTMLTIANAGQTPAEPQPGVLHLRTGDLVTAQLPNLLQSGAARGLANQRWFVIQLDGPLTPARRAALRGAGVKLGDYLPSNAFVADLTATTPAQLAQLGFITWAGPYQAQWRLDPQIGRHAFQTAERQALAARGQLAVSVYLFAGEAPDSAVVAIQQIAGAQIMVTDSLGEQALLNVVLPAGNLPALANIPAVQFVEEYPEFTYRNNSDRWIVQSNIVDVTPLYDHGIHGEGQVVGHLDGQVAVNHCSFYDTNPIGPTHRKILAYNEVQGFNLHGTHTACTAVGDAYTWDNTRGVAYLSKIVHNGIPALTESQVFSRLDLHRQQGATVHTNSWGNDSTTAYDGVCRAIDSFSWQHDDNLVCFAVTNTSTLKNPENAKDLLAVGASQDTPNQDYFCSGGTGPTADGRRKPEIYAPGCGTVSAGSSTGCSTVAMTGTSMACPAIAGTALLVRQYFTDGFYPTGTADPAHGFTPSGALLKAMLLNSAVDMTGISGYPSNLEGWGRVLADNAVFFATDPRGLIVYDVRNNTSEGLSTAESTSYDVTVNAATDQLRITLVWHDAPAAVNAVNAAVNDLDLVATTPSGAVYLGNVFSGGASVQGGTADTKNNVEQIHVNNPEVGTWSVSVSGSAVNYGVQGYALVITGDVDNLVCPQITLQPGSQGVADGQTTVFGVTAIGTLPLSYQWRKQGIPLSDGGNIAGATTDLLTISPASFPDAGVYDVVVTNVCGSQPSVPGTLTIWQRGDMNCDGSVNFGDINPYVLAIQGESEYEAQYPGCNWYNADINGDTYVDFADINPFVALLSR